MSDAQATEEIAGDIIKEHVNDIMAVLTKHTKELALLEKKIRKTFTSLHLQGDPEDEEFSFDPYTQISINYVGGRFDSSINVVVTVPNVDLELAYIISPSMKQV